MIYGFTWGTVEYRYNHLNIQTVTDEHWKPGRMIFLHTFMERLTNLLAKEI